MSQKRTKKSSKARNKPVPVARKPRRSETLSDLAALQSIDPHAEVDFAARSLRAERGGWREPIPEDRVTLNVSRTVTASFSTRDVVEAFVSGFEEALGTSPNRAGFESLVRSLMQRRPDLSERDARTARLKQHAAATIIHAQEATRAFVRILPDLLALAVSIAAVTAQTMAEEAATRYQPRDIATGESIRFEFTMEERIRRREEVIRYAQSEVRKILKKMRGVRGRKGKHERDLQAFTLRATVFDEKKALGLSDRAAWIAARSAVAAAFPELQKDRKYESAMKRGKKLTKASSIASP